VRIEVDDGMVGRRLDIILSEVVEGLGRADVRRLFADGKVEVRGADGKRCRAGKGLRASSGMVITLKLRGEELTGAALADDTVPLRLALTRADLVVVDKSAGVPSAPIRSGERGTIANALVARFPEMAAIGLSPREPGLCHRIDNGTSGLLLAARTSAAFSSLIAALRDGAFVKRYLAVCSGSIADDGEIDLPLANQKHRVVFCSDPAKADRLGARAATSTFRVVERGRSRMLVEVSAARAHRHQVRVHLAAAGAPIVGDTLYGGETVEALDRHALHASHLAWCGNGVVAPFDVSSPLPDDLRALL